jgi:hypothetical protein
MVSLVDLEKQIGLTTSKKEIAAQPLGSPTTCPRFAGNPTRARSGPSQMMLKCDTNHAAEVAEHKKQ